MEEDSSAVMDVDLLVLGGGIAGVTAAAYAASKGLLVGVVEKAQELSGSSVLSAGGVAAPLEARFCKTSTRGRPSFCRSTREPTGPRLPFAVSH